MFTGLLELKVGLTVKVFCLNESCFLLLVMVKQYHITRKVLILFYAYNMADLQGLPLSS